MPDGVFRVIIREQSHNYMELPINIGTTRLLPLLPAVVRIAFIIVEIHYLPSQEQSEHDEVFCRQNPYFQSHVI